MLLNTVRLLSFPSSISKGSLKGINVNVCFLIFTEKRGIAQISNVHLFSRQLSSGQSFSLFHTLCLSYTVPVFHASPEGLPLLVQPRWKSQELLSWPTEIQWEVSPQQKAGKDAANI